MKKIRFSLSIGIMILLYWAPPAASSSEWEVLKTLKIDKQPIDLLVSADKSRFYILTDKGEILIYAGNGQYRDAIEVGRDIDQIKEGPGKDTLFLLNRKKSTIQVVRVSVIETIDTSRAPLKGAAEAAVSLVIFSDFQ